MSAAKLTLERLKHVLICFSPVFYRTASIREFLCRVNADKVRKSNQDCEVQVKVLTKIEPFVQLTYQDNSKQVIRTDALKIDDILNRIKERTERMDRKQLFDEAGWHDLYIVSDKEELPPGVKRFRGKFINVPRDDPED